MIQIKLISARKTKGYTQEKLAKQIGVEQTTLSRKEKGLSPISDDEWRRISSVLEVPIEDIKEVIDNLIFPDSMIQNQSDDDQYITIPKNVFEELLKSKDQQISLLKNMLEKN